MGFVSLYYFAKRAQRAAITFPVVRHVAEIALHLRGFTQRLDYLPLAVSKRFFAGLARIEQTLAMKYGR